MTIPIPRLRVRLGLSHTNVPLMLTGARTIYNAMSAVPAEFANPTPTMPVLLVQIQAAETAQLAMGTHAAGTTAVRNAKVALLWTSLESLETYVQGLCDASPEQAMTLITAAAMQVATPPKHDKPALAAKVGVAPGTAVLTVNRGLVAGATRKLSLFNWAYSLDGGKTWVATPSTPFASTEVQGLPSLTTVSFRASATVAKVTGDWCQAVTLLTH